jgi:hypothetical protein
MQLMTKKAVQKILTSTNHALDVADFDDVEALDRLAEKISNVTPDERRLLKQPFELCGIKFYPLTVAKSLWYAEKCEEWDVRGLHQDALLFWLLSLPLTEAALDTYSTRKAADKAVRRLSRRLHCTAEEMTDVFQRCAGSSIQTDDTDTEKTDDTDYGGLVACLIREYGGKPEQWLYETPVVMIGVMLDQYIRRINAESEAASSSSAKHGKAIAPAPTARLKALKAFREKVVAIEKKWSVTDGE